MRVLGIDPGLRLTGFGCVEGPDRVAVAPVLVDAGVIRLAPSSGPTPEVAPRLAELERDLGEIIERNRPELIAVEAIFSHKEHPYTAVLMAHARGVILLVAQRFGCGIMELPPAEVKRAMTGSGRATKEQMQACVTRVLRLAEPPRPADIADALCIAIAARQRALMPPSLGLAGHTIVR